MEDFAIKVENVSKAFKLPHEKNNSIKSVAVNFYKRKKGYELQRALKDVSFEVKKGEFFGIVGRNGSGKSTLLKLLAGIYSPTKGEVHIRGSLTPFIELGVGFNMELTGRENVYLNGALLGFSRQEMGEMYKDIVEFAELEKFMDQKLKNYSSGMQVRLAFSIAIRAQSDILLLDEVLAVGDAAFQRKCLDYFSNLKKNKKTVIFVSHDMESVKKYCDRAILINKGIVSVYGQTNSVVKEYASLMFEEINIKNNESVQTNESTKTKDIPLGMNPSSRVDKTKIKINEVWLENTAGKKNKPIEDDEVSFSVKMEVEFLENISKIVPGIIVSDLEDKFITATNTKWSSIQTGDYKKGDKVVVSFNLPNYYERGEYNVTANVVSDNLETFYCWKNKVQKIYIKKEHITGAATNPRVGVKITKAI